MDIKNNPFVTPDPVAQEYRRRQKIKHPTLFATIGQHSVGDAPENKESTPTLFATVGNHSTQKVNEDIATDSVPMWDRQHLNNNPLDHNAFDARSDKLKQPHANFHHHDVDSPHRGHIDKYSIDSSALNKDLHKAGGDPWKVSGRHLEWLHGLDKALDHESKGDAVVYSGLHTDPSKHFKGDEEHTTFHHPAFLSTSTSLHIAANFAEPFPTGIDMDRFQPRSNSNTQERSGPNTHVLRLHVPKGTKAVSVSGGKFDRESLKSADFEHEVLLHRGMQIRIHRSPSVMKNYRDQKIAVWHGEVVGHEFDPVA